MTLTTGMDISDNSGQIQWDKVDPKLLNFVFARANKTLSATETYKDTLFGEYWTTLKQLKIPRGAYHRCHPAYDPEEGMKLFLSMYAPEKGDIVPTIDIEDEWDSSIKIPLDTKLDRIRTMVRILTARIKGQKPMIYTKVRVWTELGNPAEFGDCPLWLMDYHSSSNPPVPSPWKRFTFWQNAENIKKPPVIEDYDPDYFNGPVSDLAKVFIKDVADPVP